MGVKPRAVQAEGDVVSVTEQSLRNVWRPWEPDLHVPKFARSACNKEYMFLAECQPEAITSIIF